MKTKSLSHPNPSTLQPNWPAGLLSDSSASRFQHDVSGTSPGHNPGHQKGHMHMACFGTRHWISGLKLLLSPTIQQQNFLPCVSVLHLTQGAPSFTESHSHQLYLGPLHLLESTSFLFQPGCCSKLSDTHASEAGRHSPLPETSLLSWRHRLQTWKTGR